jgi:hypothetical protein
MYEITQKLFTAVPPSSKGYKSICSYSLTNKKGEDEGSTLYFVECKSELVEATGENTILENIVTKILMCFTNIDIFITVRGIGLTISGPF